MPSSVSRVNSPRAKLSLVAAHAELVHHQLPDAPPPENPPPENPLLLDPPDAPPPDYLVDPPLPT